MASWYVSRSDLRSGCLNRWSPGVDLATEYVDRAVMINLASSAGLRIESEGLLIKGSKRANMTWRRGVS